MPAACDPIPMNLSVGFSTITTVENPVDEEPLVTRKKKRKRECSVDECKSLATFGYPGSAKSRCALHSQPNDTNIHYQGIIRRHSKGKTCIAQGCTNPAIFGIYGEPPLRCRSHRTKEDMSARRRTCTHPQGCTKTAIYALAGKKASFCKSHAPRGSVRGGFIVGARDPAASDLAAEFNRAVGAPRDASVWDLRIISEIDKLKQTIAKNSSQSLLGPLARFVFTSYCAANSLGMDLDSAVARTQRADMQRVLDLERAIKTQELYNEKGFDSVVQVVPDSSPPRFVVVDRALGRVLRPFDFKTPDVSDLVRPPITV